MMIALLSLIITGFVALVMIASIGVVVAWSVFEWLDNR